MPISSIQMNAISARTRRRRSDSRPLNERSPVWTVSRHGTIRTICPVKLHA
uniref:Uncharacterized protein n=1 Tax=Ascaris lumbricoides TaxID=6252 RepID=A0A0M3IJY2_ASCLU